MESLTGKVLRGRTSALTSLEQEILERAIARVETFAAGEIVVPQGKPIDVSTLLVEGMMTRHIDAIDGRRHLVAVHVPGDFVDLHAYALKHLDHDVGALTDVKVAIIPHTALERIQAIHDHLTRRLWFMTMLDAAVHRQWVFRLASLNAVERVAHFLCETNARLLAIGESDGLRFVLPMTQVDIGEVCSLTNVHVNRVLRQLREMELCSLRSSRVEIHNLRELANVGKFRPDYLYLNESVSLRATGYTPELP